MAQKNSSDKKASSSKKVSKVIDSEKVRKTISKAVKKIQAGVSKYASLAQLQVKLMTLEGKREARMKNLGKSIYSLLGKSKKNKGQILEDPQIQSVINQIRSIERDISKLKKLMTDKKKQAV
ncbi:MAG: hypothetical protein JW827_09460 [Spirochaetes bacterium]|nr:hypothetical protein [Spirochaetota bacterium]